MQGKFRHAWLVLYVPVYLIGFYFVEKLVPSTFDYWVSYCSLDDMIPFHEIFIIPYYLWYPLLVAVGVYLMARDIPEFKRYMYCIIIGFTFSMVFCLLFPNGQDLRPETFARDNILVDLVKTIYRVDTNTNVMPSVHVLGSIFAVFGVWSTKTITSKWIKGGTLVLAVLISASICFTKQHSILDLFGSLLVGTIIYAIVYIFIKRRMRDS